MADNRYIIELILQAKDQTATAFASAARNQKSLNRLLEENDEINRRLEDSYKRVSNSTNDTAYQVKKVDKSYEDLNARLGTHGELLKEDAALQRELTRSAENYIRVISDQKSNEEDIAAALERRERAERRLISALIDREAGVTRNDDAETRAAKRREVTDSQRLEFEEAVNAFLDERNTLLQENARNERDATDLKNRTAYLKQLQKEGEILRQNGFKNDEVTRRSRANIQRLGLEFEAAGGKVEDFEAAKRKALTIDDTDARRIAGAFDRIKRSLATAQNEKNRAFAAEGRGDTATRINATLNADQAVKEALAAREYIQSLFSGIEARIGLDTSGVIEKIPEIEALKQFIGKDQNFHIEAEIDNASIAKVVTLKEGIGGLTTAISDGMNDAGKGISSFDNLVRGLLTLTLALFFQQILITVIGLAAGLTALASSAIAAGAALGGALAAGALQAAPAIGVLAAFANRITNIFGAVKQANLLQQQESYKGGQAATKQASQLNQVVSASERVKEAQDKVTEARKKARDELEKLTLQEQKQSLSLEKAQDTLTKAIGSGGSFAIQEAQIGVTEAKSSLSNTRSELRSRRRAGISGSPEVKEATKNLNDAKRALTQAKESAAQAGAAVSAAGGKLNFLLDQLSSSEKRLYQAILRLQNTWRKFAQQITAPLINSFTYAVNRVNTILKSSQIVSLGKDISKALSASFKQAFDFLLSDSVINRLTVLGREFTKNLKPLTNIAINLAKVFLDLAELGSPVLETLLKYIDDLIQGLADFTASVQGKKDIAAFFEGGTAALIKFVDVLRALGRVILAVIGTPGSGMGLDAGNNLLDIFIKYLNDLADAINSPDSKLRAFFQRFFKYADDIVLAFGPIIKSLAGVIDQIFTEQGIKNVQGFSEFVASVLIPGFATAAAGLAKITTAFVDLAKALPIVNQLAAGFLAVFIGGGVLGRILALVAPIKSIYQYAFVGKGSNNIFKLMGADADKAKGRVEKFLDAVIRSGQMPDKGKNNFSSFASRRFPPVSAAERVKDLRTTSESMVSSTGQLIDPTTGRFTTKEKVLAKNTKPGRVGKLQNVVRKTPVLGKLAMGAGFAGGAEALAASGGSGSAIASIGAALGPIGLAAAAIAAVVAAVVGLLAISGKLDDVWKAIKDTVSGVFKSIMQAVGELAKEITGEKSVKKAFAEILGAAKAVGSFLAAVLIPLIKIIGTAIGVIIVAGIKRLTAAIRTIKGIVGGLIKIFNGIKQFWENIFSDPKKAFEGLNSVKDGILQIIKSLAEGIFNFLKAPFEALSSVAGNVFKNITGKIESIFIGVINFIIRGVNKALDLINKIPGVEIAKVAEVQTPEQRKQSEKREKAQATRDLQNASGPSRSRVLAQSRETRQYRREQGKTDPTRSSRKSSGKSEKPTEVDNKNAENFLGSFNPETVKLSGEITKKLSRYWQTLRREARTASNYVINRLNDVRKDGGKDIDKFVDQASQNFQRLRRSVRSNMLGVANIVRNQMYLAKKAVYDGAVYMKDALNEALDSVGSNSKVKLSLEAPKRDDRGGKASGGWIGNRGERGRDAVPTMLGRGEAVLNWQQQKVVEPALYKTYGFGLDDMFSRTKGYHAGGPVRGGLAKGGRAGGLFRSGRASWFGGANDSMNTGTALGLPDTAPGIALLNQSTLGKYFRVVSPQGRWRKLRQIDIGPAAWTGKILDITSAALKYFGYNERNFPTGRGIWKVYGPVGSGGASGGGSGGALANIAAPIIKGGTEQMRELVKKSTKKMVDAANRKLEREAPAVPDGGSLDVPKGASGSLRAAMALAQRMGLQITSTTGGGHAPNSWHYQGRAFDAAGPANRMAAFFRAALKRYGKNILELFYDPLGGIKNGQSIGAIGDHMDHVHLALARGGRALQRFAYGGHIKGAPDGQPVPIIAHSGEWVLNKKQQGMVAAAAGLSPNALKGKLGFSGGPTSFAGGGEVKGPTFPTITINTSRNLFDKYINEFASSINKLVEKVLSVRGIEKATKKIEKDIERLKKGGTTDAEDKRIEKLKEKLKSLERTTAVDALLKATRQITGTDGEGGALSVFFEGIKRTFDKVSGAINLGSANLSKIKEKGFDKIVLGAGAEDLDPVKIAEKQAKAQEELRDGLIRGVRVYSIQIEKLQKAANRIGRTKNSKGEVVNRNLDQLIALQAKDQKKLDKLDGDDLSKEEKKRQKQLKDRIAARKKEIDAKTKLNGEINLLEDQRRQREQEIIEAEQARLEAEQKAFEERTKQLTRAVDISDAATNFAKSLADLTGNSGGVKTALDALAENAKSRRDTLQQRLDAAQQRLATDPRWQSVVDDLQQQVYDAQLAVAQTMADIIDNAVSGIENTFQRAETTRGLSDRMAAVAEKMVAGAGNTTRRTNLEARGRDLVTQRDALAALLSNPSIQGNAKQLQDLRDKIAELDVTIAENTQEINDLNLQIRQQAVDRITGVSSRTGGLLGNAGSIFENISRTLGQPNTQNQISLAESLRTALGLEGTNLSAELASFLADPNSGGLLGADATGVLQQLLSAFNSGDPGSFATTLQALAPQIALLESTLGESARGPFQSFIDSLVNNTIAVTDNTANLAELNGLANQPQPFSTTAWTRFRAAIFNGIGDLLPQFQVPQMATGGYITQGGLFQLHPGEFVVNANQSNIPNNEGDINITVNEANKPLDVTALASRIAFEKRTRK